MAKIIAVANQKGAVGKTTTTVNLSASLAVAEKRVLIVDLDPQAHATSCLGLKVNRKQTTIYDVLINDGQVETSICDTELHYLKVIPSHIDLSGGELEIAGFVSRETRLRDVLLSSINNDYEFIFLDCPPALNLLTLNALTAKDFFGEDYPPKRPNIRSLLNFSIANGIDPSGTYKILEEVNSQDLLDILLLRYFSNNQPHKVIQHFHNTHCKELNRLLITICETAI